MNELPGKYPKRLIEVDLPIKAISAHARREKSIRHGHISTLHLWWARRPLAACRAVICASLWPDPGDDLCPSVFRKKAAKALCRFAEKVQSIKHLGDLCQVGGKRWQRTDKQSLNGEVRCCWELRYALLDFIADFANWDASSVPEFIETARAITQAAHEALGGASGTRPLVIDPFAGGGSIPFEALRVGADAFASDLNPVSVLLNKVVLEYIPKYGQLLVDEVRKRGEWVQREAARELGDCYPKDPDGATPVAYLWARTIRCEGPGCGAVIPLLKSSWVSRRRGNLVAVKLLADKKSRTLRWELERPASAGETRPGTIALGSATCPVCAYTTQKDRVRAQLKERHGGTDDALLYCVVIPSRSGEGRDYRLPTNLDRQAAARAARRARELAPSLVPDEPIPQERVWKNNPIRVHLYGIVRWGELFSPRQRLSVSTYARLARQAAIEARKDRDAGLAEAVGAVLALSVSRLADISNAHCQWENTKTQVRHLFTRQAISMLWDFAEPHLFAKDAAGNFSTTIGTMIEVLQRQVGIDGQATVRQQSATAHVLANDMATAMVTDPPYYDAVPYATLADFFYVWMRRSVPPSLEALFSQPLIDKTEECVVDEAKNKGSAFFEETMTKALSEGRRVVAPDGIGVVVFAHKSTAGWEAQLRAMQAAGWIITASWPLDTELGNRVRAQNSAALASSIHIVCRPRENSDGTLRTDDVGDWRDVLSELPKRIHEWMPRLKEEGIVGADAIFACLGPALEIFSRYSKVEDAAGNEIKLKTYLEKVWEAVAKEALSVIFSGADTTGFEPDARLTAMWLWTLFSASSSTGNGAEDEDADDDDEEDAKKAKPKTKGFSLEYDAARKIAQGLGADLERMSALVEIKGETARLLSVDERRKTLFAKGESAGAEAKSKAAKKKGQLALGYKADSDEEPASDPAIGVGSGAVQVGQSVLDRVHQAMILFGANQGAALKRFLIEDQVGKEDRFWSLAQHLSALYPANSSEKRLVDGVLARKKGLGF